MKKRYAYDPYGKAKKLGFFENLRAAIASFIKKTTGW